MFSPIRRATAIITIGYTEKGIILASSNPDLMSSHNINKTLNEERGAFMKAVVIGAAGHIGTYLIPMLVNAGYDTVAITRKMTQPYEDAPAWHTVKRELLDRENDPDFIRKAKGDGTGYHCRSGQFQH
jgi:NADPH:quinone reductase-like Zn-dependent oxidoreductase